MASEDDLIGSWRLVSWTISYPDGRKTHPFGEAPEGMILYTADGAMSAAIARSGRPLFGRADIRNAPEGERAAAYDSYFSYAGRWTLDGDQVRHEVTLALNPDFVGTTQVRDVLLQGETLTLSADEGTGAKARHHALVWKRRG